MKLSVSRILTLLMCLSIFCGIFIIPYVNTYVQVLILDLLCIFSVQGIIVIPQQSKSWISLIIVLVLSSVFGVSLFEGLKYALLIGSVIWFSIFIMKTNNYLYFKKIYIVFCIVETCFIIIQYFVPVFVEQLNSFLLSPQQYSDVQTYYRLHKACVGISVSQPFAMFFSYCVFAYGVECSIRKFKFWNLSLAILGIIGIFFAGKRSGIIILVISLIVLFLFSFEKRKGIPKSWKYFVICLSIIGIYLLLFTSMGKGILEKNITLSSSGDITNGRSSLNSQMFNLFLDNPILGIGPLATLDYTGENLGHNIYLQYLSESGIIGFICLISLIVGNVYKTIKCINHSNLVGNNDLYFSLLIQVFVIVYGFLGNPFYNIIFLIPYALFTTSIGYIFNRIKGK